MSAKASPTFTDILSGDIGRGSSSDVVPGLLEFGRFEKPSQKQIPFGNDKQAEGSAAFLLTLAARN